MAVELNWRVRRELKLRFPWMTRDLLDVYTREWAATDDPAIALQATRQSNPYKRIFAGNYDPDTGEVRMGESEYFAAKSSYNATIASLGLNPKYFEDEFVRGLKNEVSPAELEARAEAAYERIIDTAPQIRWWYAKNYNLELTDAAIVGAVLNPKVNELILNRKITMAEIGGMGQYSGFNVSRQMARQLYNAGIDKGTAGQLFGVAKGQLPVLQVLAQRHADPDDDFDLENFVESAVRDDPVQRKRMRRLVEQEYAGFSGNRYQYARSEEGGLAGLEDR